MSMPLTAFELVRAPRALSKFIALVLLSMVALPIVLVVVPWQQNVTASGRVTALDPLDRVQVIPAPVTGRLVDLRVREGERVEKGQILAELADQDPEYALRLEQQLDLTGEEVRAARDMVEFYDQQLVYLEDAREQAVSQATFELQVAIEKVRGAEQDLEGLEAELDQKRADRERKSNLWTQGVVSELDFQKAEADYLSAKAKVAGAQAKVEQARNEERAKMATVSKIAADQRAKIESTKSTREKARSDLAGAEKKLTEAVTKVERQKTQLVVAPRAGAIQRVHAAGSADLLKQGDPLIELVPDSTEMAVELWVRGVDAPLVEPGRPVRLQFEGWPAVTVGGWPSVAVGTFGGRVAAVDPYGNAKGEVRILVTPDAADEAWPEAPYLRQGGRANGWILLDTVRLGYEAWRQLNAFPPALQERDGALKGTGAKDSSGKGTEGKVL